MLTELSQSNSSTVNSEIKCHRDGDFATTKSYEALIAELLRYKQQRDNAREKAARYRSQLTKALEELKLQTSKFELLAQEFRRVIGIEENESNRGS